jgi:hypothetical protein
MKKASEIFGDCNINLIKTDMIWTEDDVEQLWNEIENEGLGYWIQNYGYKGEDKELENLCKEARLAMNKLDNYTQELFDKFEIG